MPKKKVELSEQEQGEHFKKEVRRMIDAGELSPTDADAALDRLLRKASNRRPPSQ